MRPYGKVKNIRFGLCPGLFDFELAKLDCKVFGYDVIPIIYCDFGALITGEQIKLLKNILWRSKMMFIRKLSYIFDGLTLGYLML